MTVYTRWSVSLKRAGAPWSISLAFILLGGGFALIWNAPGALAQSAGNAALLANLRGQIQRYGCNMPQYAATVPGCRALHARVRALQSGGGSSRPARQPYSGARKYTPAGYSSRRTQRPKPSSSGGGFFSVLFGGGSARRNAQRYGSYGASNGRMNTPSYARGNGRYRTLCVRTCDGYYWPMSFSTTRSGIARDANQCKISCSSQAKLFYYPNPGADVVNMVDLQGKPYTQMENSFRYRKEYVKTCRCKPEPWSEAARQVYEQRSAQADTSTEVKTAENAPISSPVAMPASAAPRVNYPPSKPRRRSSPRYSTDGNGGPERWRAGSW